MALNRRITSRFRLSEPILTRDGESTFGIAKKYRFMDRSKLSNLDIRPITVPASFAGRPDLLAETIYGDAELHWILIIFNRVENPFNWPLTGQIIEVPSPSVVSAEL